MLTRDNTELADPGSSPITIDRVVPSLANRWSHHTGGTTTQVVPCRWRATRCTAEFDTSERSLRWCRIRGRTDRD